MALLHSFSKRPTDEVDVVRLITFLGFWCEFRALELYQMRERRLDQSFNSVEGLEFRQNEFCSGPAIFRRKGGVVEV